MTMITYRHPARRDPVPAVRPLGDVWRQHRPNLARVAVEFVMDRVNRQRDAEAAAWGLTVTRKPWGGREVRDPRVAVYLHRRRVRMLRGDLDATDRALLAAAGVNLARLADYRDATTRAAVAEAFTPGARPRPAPARADELADELVTRTGALADALDRVDQVERDAAAAHLAALRELREALERAA